MQTNTKYPEHWRKALDPKEAYYWEISPHTAAKNEVILSKRNELGILSNFAATPFTLHNECFASIEGFWQMMKFPENLQDPRNKNSQIHWPHTRKEVAQMVGLEARHAGDMAGKNMRELGISWITYQGEQLDYKGIDQDRHYQLVYQATMAKVNENPKVKEILIATGDLILRPDHATEPDATPAYRYFDIYMEIRSRLLSQAIP